MIDQSELWDKNIFKRISKCFINSKGRFKNEIFAIYEDGTREVIFSYDPNKYEFTHEEFIGKSKIEAVFYCDRKNRPMSHGYHGRTYSRW